jgi:hypothetical protein
MPPRQSPELVRQSVFLDVKLFRIANIGCQVINQPSELAQIGAEIEVVNLAAGSARRLVEANHFGASLFFSQGIVRFGDRGNASDSWRARIGIRRPY